MSYNFKIKNSFLRIYYENRLIFENKFDLFSYFSLFLVNFFKNKIWIHKYIILLQKNRVVKLFFIFEFSNGISFLEII